MAFQNFHRWGERNYDELIDIMKGTDYSTDVKIAEEGETAFNETFEGTMHFCPNFLTTPEAGVFVDSTMTARYIGQSSSIFARYWCHPTSNNTLITGGGLNTVGIMWNWALFNQLQAFQHSGIAYTRISSTSVGTGTTITYTQRSFVNSENGVDLGMIQFTGDTTTGFIEDIGIAVSEAPYNGSCTVLINGVERE